MKHVNSFLAAILMIALPGLLSCMESTEKKVENVEKAEYKLMTAEAELEKSQSDSAMAYSTFQLETDRILAANEIKMLELKAKLVTQRSEINTKYERDIETLRIENEKLRTDLKDFTYGNKENWETFKSNVNRDIDKLGKSISEMAEKSAKRN